MPEVSVIIPSFNRAQDTVRAAASALAQDVDLEVVVVDDGSAEPFSSDASGVRVLRLDRNCGPATARNAGVASARAEWVAFLDSDDTWPNGSLRPRLTAAQRTSAADSTIFAGGFLDRWPDRRSRTVRIPRNADRPEEFAAGCWMCPGSTALFTKGAWTRSGGQDPTLRRLEDYEWLFRWGLGGGRLSVHRGLAAVITRGRRARLAAVAAAAGSILARHSSAPRGLRRRMKAYLALERGAAALGDGKRIAAAAALTQSFLMYPRRQIALEPFWTFSDAGALAS